jgi:N,N'-diacetyllegionaminate synthase
MCIRDRDKTEMYTYWSQGVEVTESQYEMFKRTEFTEEEWKEIKNFCDEQEITFLSTVSGIDGMELLLRIGVDAVKVGSDDFVNLPLLGKYEKYDLPMIVSCGMATEEEVAAALLTLRVKEGHPVCLMLCTSEYPTPPEDVNARKLLTISERFPEVMPGLSDHTQGNTAAVVAAAYGARVFEKHFTLDHELPGPDHWFSANPAELKAWVKEIRTACVMLGSSELKPTQAEEAQRFVMHRSIAAAVDIKAGERLTEENLVLLRPGGGIEPRDWDHVIGRKIKKDLLKGMKLTWEDIDDQG